MTDKDPKDMTVSELLRKAGNGYEGANGTVMMNLIDLMGLSRKIRHSECLYALADKIDAELAQARELSLRQGAELWAKANGWPDFREGEDFGQWLVRCAIKRPCFENGEPVQWSDSRDIAWNPDGEWFFNAVKEDGVPIAIGSEKVYAKAAMTDDGRVVRHAAPEVLGADGKPMKVGETVYPIDGEWLGIPLEVLGIESLSVKVSLPSGKGWTIFVASELTHESPVLGADGKPIVVGETVYPTYGFYAGTSGKVVSVEHQDNVRVELCCSTERFDGCYLTHTPPDTQNAIDDDATMHPAAYCATYGIDLGDDPDRATTTEAMVLDLLRRQRELDKRTGGAE